VKRFFFGSAGAGRQYAPAVACPTWSCGPSTSPLGVTGMKAAVALALLVGTAPRHRHHSVRRRHLEHDVDVKTYHRTC
jgi:hypothetical protein